MTSSDPTVAQSATPAPVLRRGLLVAGVVLVAINLRPALAAVGPLALTIQSATGLSGTAIGLLTTLPLLAFGVVSMLTPVVTRRLGFEGALGLALVLLGAGIALRSIPSGALLFGGTVLLGVGIALGNVLLPAIVKRDFADRSGPMTSLYSSGIGLGATLAAAASVPLATTFGLGWRGALAAWAVPAALAFLVWLPQLRHRTPVVARTSVAASLKALGRAPLAWQVALFMGLQSFTFYAILAWLPALLQSRGVAEGAAGLMLALAQATGIAGSAVIPTIAARRADQRSIIAALMALQALALGGLMLPGVGMPALWVGLLGFVLGASFGLSLLLLVVRAADAETAAALSGMAQSVGYFVAALGPALFGALHDATGGWTLPLLSLLAAFAVQSVMGWGAGRDRVVQAGGS